MLLRLHHQRHTRNFTEREHHHLPSSVITGGRWMVLQPPVATEREGNKNRAWVLLWLPECRLAMPLPSPVLRKINPYMLESLTSLHQHLAYHGLFYYCPFSLLLWFNRCTTEIHTYKSRLYIHYSFDKSRRAPISCILRLNTCMTKKHYEKHSKIMLYVKITYLSWWLYLIYGFLGYLMSVKTLN